MMLKKDSLQLVPRDPQVREEVRMDVLTDQLWQVAEDVSRGHLEFRHSPAA